MRHGSVTETAIGAVVSTQVVADCCRPEIVILPGSHSHFSMLERIVGQFLLAQDPLVINAATRLLMIELILEDADLVCQSLQLVVEG